MKIISFNVRGLGGKAKSLCLRTLFTSLKPDVILLQETMCSSLPALLAFSKILPSWEFCAVDALGLSGGILTAWNPRVVRCKAFRIYAGLLIQASFRGLSYPISILNVYGPYKDRGTFWDNAFDSGFLGAPDLILGGDLNLTLNSSEIWGTKSCSDPLSSYFKGLFDSLELLDIAPPCAGPTWRNGRADSEGISKRLDRFLISGHLLPSLGLYRVWTHCSDISDHYPIILEWNKHNSSHNYPFKFNPVW